MWFSGLFQTLWRWGKFRDEQDMTLSSHWTPTHSRRVICHQGSPGSCGVEGAQPSLGPGLRPELGKERKDALWSWSGQTHGDVGTDGL